MTVHIDRSLFVAGDPARLDPSQISARQRHELGAIRMDRLARHLVIFMPAPGDLDRLIAAARTDLPDLAPLQTVQRVMSHNPDSVLAIAQRHKFDAAAPQGEGFVACLMLNAAGLAALKAGIFDAADPPERYRVLQRFYRLPAPLIARFYAGQSTVLDRIRILAGRPPVSIWRAMRALKDKE